jgi:SAM-dependent methyltransferase
VQALLRAAFHLSSLRARGATRVAIVVDSDTGVRADTVAALLHPWRSWLDVTEVLVTSTDPGEAWLEIGAGRAQAVSIVTDRDGFAPMLESAARRHGLSVLHSDYSTSSERAGALFHEMSHHHYEIGGLNEWDGAPTVYARFLLQQLSVANCVTHFPQYMLDGLRTQYAASGRALEALDVGSGPVSRLRWGALQGLLHVTGVDPLLDVYDIILTHHGLDGLPAIRVGRSIPASAEDLGDHVAPASFDFAFCCNALDHVENPPAVIGAIAHALRPGAFFALEFATREGSRQGWRQLHQFDLFLDARRNELMCQWRDDHVTALVPNGVPLVLDEVVTDADDYTAVILRHDARRLRSRRSLRPALRRS